MNYLISIIVPVFNVEKYLHRCLNSILDQTYTNIEVILIDDGSTDKSSIICDEIKAKDNRVIVIHKSNGGLSSARNAGLEIAKGDFIGFVDSDDLIENDMYEQLINACIANHADLSMCGRNNLKEDGSVAPVFTLPKQEIWTGKQAISNLLIYNNIDSSACDKLFSKKIFHDIHFPMGKFCEDVFVIPTLLCNAEVVVHIGVAKYYYFQRFDSLSHTEFSLIRMDILEAHKFVSDYVKFKFPELIDKANSFYYRAITHIYYNYYMNDGVEKFPILKSQINHLAYSNLLAILFNRYIHRIQKVVFLLNNLKIYKFLLKIKSLISF